jgi:hypothetical protein
VKQRLGETLVAEATDSAKQIIVSNEVAMLPVIAEGVTDGARSLDRPFESAA